MKRMMILLFLIIMASFALSQPSQTKLKVFISVDMEGVAGVVSGKECSPSGPDYTLFRQLIRTETTLALNQRSLFRPYKLKPPYRMVLKVKRERGEYEGAKKTGEGIYEYISEDFLQVMDAFNTLK